MMPRLTFILGGVASGKSAQAEALAQAVGPKRVYVATAQARDPEMAEKVAAHQARRAEGWTTIEAPMDVASALAEATADVVLLDCISMWLTNHLLAESDLGTETGKLVGSLRACPAPVIVVSNEVGLGGVSPNTLARRFAAAQGRLNQDIAAIADRVIFVAAGLPVTLKGAD